MRSFVKIKSSRNDEITLSFTNIHKSWPSREFFCVTNMSFIVIRKDKIPANFRIYSNNGAVHPENSDRPMHQLSLITES